MTIITRRRASAALWLLLLAGPAAALDLPLPSGAQVTFDATEEGAAYHLPTGRWSGEALPTRRIDGTIDRTAWRIAARDLTPLQILDPIREALEAEGWDIVLDCETRGCGGFDFRFATEVLPAPAMYVDLTDYRFLSATRGDEEALGLLVSSDGSDAYVQLIRATPEGSAPAQTVPAQTTPTPASAAPDDLAATLQATGHAILSDLDFASGDAALPAGSYASLDALADYLAANPDLRVLFVGHTDATGSQEANRALSRRRAEAAATYLRDSHDLPAARVGAEGAGYLAPVASNLTEDGRNRNRRVEAVILPLS
ncbi:OmpA family protein [Roseivivax sediminis]|uniref:OmpA-OmpF porin, OOP family n=1 Tax=Roseivivax sediminis TaxID=936889 RepID=A0A1I1ZP38_9RHOB|nr:OmpA family protein [Roseivivax sediminis]SFE33098.1 OmpA-OmpF porin, OOP family [Roseivivax sediminis]